MGGYVVQLLPDAVEATVLAAALRSWIDNNPGAPDSEIDAAYEMLGKLRKRHDRVTSS
jgi:hypothetical protein